MTYWDLNRQCPSGTTPYIATSADTLYTIARRFNTTVQALIAANPGINPANIQGGQSICVPRAPQAQPVNACSAANLYVVVEGDTFFTIAQKFNVSVQALMSANPGASAGNLYGGRVLCIPLAPSPVSIVVDTGPKTLTLYRNGRVFKTYRIAHGKPSTPSPIGTFTIANKQVNPGGPFGTRWMGLSKPTYGIHGTSHPESIGSAASNGCIRMLNRDVNELFNLVPVGTVVRIR